MPNLSDFLKCEKVRCVQVTNGAARLVKGKEYKVISIDYLSITDEDGDRVCVDSDWFEPVLDPAIQATNALDDTPMDTRTEFEVGDKVYYKNEPKIHIIQGIDENDNTVHFGINGKYGFEWWTAENLVLATPENYEMLCKLYPHIEFEAPVKEITGSDLCRAMLDKGWKYVPCYVSNNSDEFATKAGLSELIIATDADRTKEFVGDDVWTYAVPFDPRTGSVLTSEVLDD